jgi:hypothetical protein
MIAYPNGVLTRRDEILYRRYGKLLLFLLKTRNTVVKKMNYRSQNALGGTDDKAK